MVLRGAVLAVLLFTGGAAAQEPDVTGPANRAFADTAATAEVTGQAKTAVAALFSYTWADLGKWHAAVQTWATGEAAKKLEDQLAPSIPTINRQQVTTRSEVVSLGLRDLRGDRAELLVFLNTRTERRNQGATSSASNAVIKVQRGPQRWQVVEIEVPQ